MKDETVLALAAMACLTIIVVVCLFYGVDHAVVAGVCITIAGLGGYELKAWRVRRQIEGG